MRTHISLAIKGGIFLILIISAIYLPKTMLLYSGYCFEQERYLTVQEKFDIAVTQIIKNQEKLRLAYTVTEAGGKIYSGKTLNKLQYSNLKEFYVLNPNCCELVETFLDVDKISVIPFWSRIRGRLNIIVRVFYIYDFDEENNQPLYKKEYFGLSNCKEVWLDWDVIRLHEANW